MSGIHGIRTVWREGRGGEKGGRDAAGAGDVIIFRFPMIGVPLNFGTENKRCNEAFVPRARAIQSTVQ